MPLAVAYETIREAQRGAMLESTFTPAPGIGATTERSLWRGGAHTWDSYLEQHDSCPWRGARYVSLAETVVPPTSPALWMR